MYVLGTDVFLYINFNKGCLSMDFSMIAGAVLRGSFTSTFRLTILSVIIHII